MAADGHHCLYEKIHGRHCGSARQPWANQGLDENLGGEAPERRKKSLDASLLEPDDEADWKSFSSGDYDDYKAVKEALEAAGIKIEWHDQLPHVDKSCFYSSFAHVLRELRAKRGLTLHQGIELLVGVALNATSQIIYYAVLTLLVKEDGPLPDGNLFLHYKDKALELFGQVAGGPGWRFQPFFNKAFTEGKRFGLDHFPFLMESSPNECCHFKRDSNGFFRCCFQCCQGCK